jgi:hypothetical protein
MIARGASSGAPPCRPLRRHAGPPR